MNRFILLFLGFVFIIASCTNKKETPAEIAEPAEEVVVLDSLNEFGIIVNGLEEHKSVVKRNQTLSDLLFPFRVSSKKILEIVNASDGIFDIRKIKSGKNFIVYSADDTIKSIPYFVYETDPVNYYVFDLSDSINVYRGQKPVSVVEKAVSGTIDYSLYETLQSKDLSPNIALELSQVFAWQIDFYRIQKGDSFKIIYEEEFVGDQSVGIGKIYAAQFIHSGEEFYGIFFDKGDRSEYFDLEGNSLRKAFLKAPLKFSRISSKFSRRRLHPVHKVYRPHLGIDYAAPTGTPIQAVGDGQVIFAAYKGGNGRYVKIRHNGTYSSGYLHLSKFAKGIRSGKYVKQGDIIGYVGSSGVATGPHLDFRFWINGSPVNYLNQDFPSVEPVEKKYRNKYEEVKNIYVEKLNMIPENSSFNFAAIDMN